MKMIKRCFFIIIFATIINITVKAQGFTIANGSTLYLKSASLSIPGNWSNNGMFDPGRGKVIFNGASGDQIITCKSGDTFYDLVVNKTSGNISVTGSIIITDSLNILSGYIDADSNSIILDSSATISESNGNTFNNGTIKITTDLNAPVSDNVGGLGAEITTAVNLGITTITRGSDVQTGNGHKSIKRYFDISPENNNNLNAKLVFHYIDNELNGLDESSLVLFNSTDNGRTWIKDGGVLDTSQNTVTISGINSLSRYTLAGDLATTGVSRNKTVPTEYKLYQNFPNPFNPTTTIKYSLASREKVKLTVYNLIGQQLKQLVNENETAGYHEVTFNANSLSSGVYYYKITAGKYMATKKMILLK